MFDKALTPDEFIAEARRSTIVLQGYISWDGAHPDVLLFSPTAYVCPYVRIPKAQIETIKVGRSAFCVGPHGAGQMWSATVYLKLPDSADAKTFAGLLTAALAHVESPCSCQGSIPTGGAGPIPMGDAGPIAMSGAGTMSMLDASGPMVPPDVGVQPDTRTLWQVCFYDRDGRYAGYSYNADQGFLARQCRTWAEVHGGRCKGYYRFYTPCPNS
jgi:hypothetical protein